MVQALFGQGSVQPKPSPLPANPSEVGISNSATERGVGLEDSLTDSMKVDEPGSSSGGHQLSEVETLATILGSRRDAFGTEGSYDVEVDFEDGQVFATRSY